KAMACERCDSVRSGDAVFSVRSDILDLRVCRQCAEEARDLMLTVEPLRSETPVPSPAGARPAA
ncbi:MAG TPA: hypothetical protein VLD83_11385, partial [Candidatus Binatia bacterium]|nr:hypothetical protein [Candidatus Binatia bacterium]